MQSEGLCLTPQVVTALVECSQLGSMMQVLSVPRVVPLPGMYQNSRIPKGEGMFQQKAHCLFEHFRHNEHLLSVRE